MKVKENMIWGIAIKGISILTEKNFRQSQKELPEADILPLHSCKLSFTLPVKHIYDAVGYFLTAFLS